MVTDSKKRLLKWFIVSGFLFGLCVTYGIVSVAVRIIETSVTVLCFVADFQRARINDSLYFGNSATRVGVLTSLLTQIKQTPDAQSRNPIESQSTVWIRQALEECKGDCDPYVVEITFELIELLNNHDSSTPESS